MQSDHFERAQCYSHLRQMELRLAREIRQSLGWQAVQWLNGAERWVVDGGYFERVRRVENAIDESQGIALQRLRQKLAGLDVDIIWPILREVCHDIALYIGGGAITGGVIGAAGGFLFGGVGALPGAIGGMAVGAKAGALALSLLGLKSTVEFMLEAVPGAADAYWRGLKEAWGPMPRADRSQMYLSDFQFCGNTYFAANFLADGHEIIVLAMFMGMVAYLSRGRGNLPALQAEVRQSARLGPKVADWLGQHAQQLKNHPLLQPRGKNGAAVDAAASGRVGEAAAAATKSAVPATPKALLRDLAQLQGKSEGGPGTWQTSPKRTKGEDYQEQITGVKRGIEYDILSNDVPSGRVRFDGYDSNRKVLLDAKDWLGYPPKNKDFWHKATLKEARGQIIAAKKIPIEWHFSSKENMNAVKELLRKNGIKGIKILMTPKI